MYTNDIYYPSAVHSYDTAGNSPRMAGIVSVHNNNLRDYYKRRLSVQYLLNAQRIFIWREEAKMTKEVQMSIKMEADLRDRFMAAAAERHRPAAQIIRDLMRLYLADSETPNALTSETIRKRARGEDVFRAGSAAELFAQLGI